MCWGFNDHGSPPSNLILSEGIWVSDMLSPQNIHLRQMSDLVKTHFSKVAQKCLDAPQMPACR
jgi:hypothetical protein